ncbi:MAG: SRPBCC family protein [Armatimonadota bacterium]
MARERSTWRRGALLGGFVVPPLVGWLLLQLTTYLMTQATFASGTFTLSAFIFIPLLMGFVSAGFWARLGLGTGEYVAYSLVNTFLALVASYFTMREGVICLVIVSPLIAAFILAGALLGRYAFRGPGPLRVCVVPVVLVLIWVDARLPRHHENAVTDRLVVRARPEAVWRHVVEVPTIEPRSSFWLFRLGLPRPVRTTAEAHRVGARRLCIFEGGYTLDERITALEPNRRMAFEVVGQPRHPEIMGHLDVTRGELRLHDNGDGTTTLTGTTWYRLHVYPAWYYDRWAERIGREVHWSVMGHLKRLAEAGDGAAANPGEAPRRTQAGAAAAAPL